MARNIFLLLLAVLIAASCTSNDPHAIKSPGGIWSEVAGGLARDYGVAVDNLIVHHNELVVVGWFDSAGSIPANSIAQWNGARWTSLGPDISGPFRASTVYNDDLIVSGYHVETQQRGIWHWNGNQWDSLASAPPGCTQLLIHQGALIALGSDIARWNAGQWEDLGPGYPGYLESAGIFQGKLAVAGSFGDSLSPVAIWDGASWSLLPRFIPTPPHPRDPPGWSQPMCIIEYKGRLVIGGQFKLPDPGGFHCMAEWDGAGWHFLDQESRFPYEVHCLATDGEHLLAGGSFGSLGGRSTNSIAMWDGKTWTALGDGLTAYPARASVSTIALYDGRVIAGGFFFKAGTLPVRYLAAWEPIPPWTDGVR